MRKKLWMTIGVLGLVVVFGFGMYQSNASQGAPTLSADNIKELIAAQYPGEMTVLELVQNKNEAIYEIEIENEGMIYELKVDGTSGEVIHLNEKIKLADAEEKKNDSSNEPEQNSSEESMQEKEKKGTENKDQQTKVEKKVEKERDDKQEERAKSDQDHHANKSDYHDHKNKYKHKDEYKNKHKERKKEKNVKKTGIDVKQAIDIALKEFPGVVEEVELDENNGRLVYEIEIEADGEEAEFEIDAYTGEILVVEIDD